MTKHEIITYDYAQFVNAKAHLEAFTFSDARAENARLEARFYIEESIRWLDAVRVRLVLNREDMHPVISEAVPEVLLIPSRA